MASIFISYRRSDSPDAVKLIYETLKQRLPRWEIFYDHQSIPLGEAFPELLRTRIASADAVLVIMGPKWLEILKERKDGIDHVRTEVELALESEASVVPVLVGNSAMPGPDDLAGLPGLKPLLSRNGKSIRPDPDFDHDLAILVTHLEKLGPPEDVGTILASKYALTAQIGLGGMGVVFAADQKQPVKRTVAVKLIKPGMDSREVLARFDAERQALAVMDHPNVCKALDAGIAPSGRPFFVMEYVRGTTITEYCDEKKLTPRERLDLFIPVCQAMQHAHQKGIIHRDLKPSNVLVQLVDNQPVPKVIDFGLAKALGQELTDKSLHTAVDSRVGTLEYSSPEQAAGKTLEIDTRSDIYSLGALLYELLTGAPPFSREELLKAGEEEMRRQVKEVEPPAPSKKLSSSGQLPAIAASRGMEPAKLPRIVRGDLDWIVMKCLEKEQARRYETANQLGEELRRYLADEPVQAGPPSVAYRAKKFLRRNRGAVIAASLVLLALIGGIIGTSVGLAQAEAARRLAEDNEGKAKDAADKERLAKDDALAKKRLADEQRALALQTLRVAVSDIETQLRHKSGQQELRQKLLDKALAGLKKVARAADNSSAIDHETVNVHLELGDVYMTLEGAGLAEAEKQYRLAFSLSRQQVDADSRDTVAQDYLAVCYERLGEVSIKRGQTAEARDFFQKLHDIRKRQTDADPSNGNAQRVLAISYDKLGNVSMRLGQTPEAKVFYQRFHVICKQIADADPSNDLARRELAISFDRLGKASLDLGQPAEGKALYQKGQDIYKQLADADTKDSLAQRSLSISYEHLGNVSLTLGQTAEAKEFFEKLHEIRKQRVDADPKDTEAQRDLMFSYGNLGKVALRQGKTAEAKELYEKRLELCLQRVDADPTDTWAQTDLAVSCTQLGNLALKLGQTVEAKSYFQKVLDISKRLADTDPKDSGAQSDLAIAYNDLGDVSLSLGQSSEAKVFYQKVLNIRKKLADADPGNSPSQRSLSMAYSRLGKVSLQLGQTAEAKSFCQKGLEIAKQRTQADPGDSEAQNDLSIAYDQMGNISLRMGKTAEARGFYQKSLDICKQRADADLTNSQARRELAVSYNRMGDISLELRQPNLAKDFYQKGLDISKQLAEADLGNSEAQRDLGVSYNKLGEASLQLEQPAEARGFFQKGLDISKQRADADSKDSAAQRDLSVSFNKLGEVNLLLGQTADAMSYYQKGLDVRKNLAEADPRNSQAQRDLSVAYNNLGIVNLKQGRSTEAKGFHQKAADIDKQRVDADPRDDQAQLDLSISYERLGDVCRQLGQLALAKDIYQKLLEVNKRRSDANPGNSQVRRGMTLSYDRLGEVSLQVGQTTEAIGFYQKSLDIRKERADADPKDMQARRDLLFSYDKLGSVSMHLGKTADAKGFYQQRLEFCKPHADALPKLLEAQGDLVHSLHYLAKIAEAESDHAQARRLYVDGQQVLIRWRERGGKLEGTQYASFPAFFKENIDWCQKVEDAISDVESAFKHPHQTRYLLLERARELIRMKKLAEAAETADRLAGLKDAGGETAFFAARVRLCLASVDASESSKHVNVALKLVEQALGCSCFTVRSNRELLETHREFEAIRKLPDYARIQESIAADVGILIFEKKDVLRPTNPSDRERMSPSQVHEVKLAAGKRYTIAMDRAGGPGNLDPYLRLEDASGKELAKDDESGGNSNALIIFVADTTATYRIIATGYDGNSGTGPYVLTVRQRN